MVYINTSHYEEIIEVEFWEIYSKKIQVRCQKYKISNSNLILKCFIYPRLQDCIVMVINECRSRQHRRNDIKWKKTEVLTGKLLIVALLLQKNPTWSCLGLNPCLRG